MELTDGAVVGEPADILKDLVQAGVEVLHAAVDVALLLLDGVQDLRVMEQGVVQTGNTGPQRGDVLVQSCARAHTHTHTDTSQHRQTASLHKAQVQRNRRRTLSTPPGSVPHCEEPNSRPLSW